MLAAGQGTRMKSRLPKVLHTLFDRPMIEYVVETLVACGVKKPRVVIGNGAAQVRALLGKRASFVLQRVRHGTGHAVMMATPLLRGYRGDVLIWPGDMPLVRPETLKRFIKAHQTDKNQVSVLSAVRSNPEGYGRILREGAGFVAIREELDATPSERETGEVNTGVYVFKAGALLDSLKKIKNNNRKNEYYLTDTIEVLVNEGARVEAYDFAGEDEGLGVNSQQDLAMATAVINKREIEKHQSQGVTFMAPEQTFVSPGVKIGQGTIIYPWTYIEMGVKIGKDCSVGPFAKIRSGSELCDGASIGSFVEVNRSRVGKKVNARHLAYLGDAVVGDGTNIGAGVITANFDGRKKHKTRIGKKVLVGSNTVFVAPVSVGDQAKTGAGSVVTGGTKIKSKQVVAGVPARPIAETGNKKRRTKKR